MKVLETERLTLREMGSADAALMLELLNDPDFIRYVADRGVRTLADAANYIAEKIVPSYEKFGFGFYVMELKESGRPVGICGLIKREAMDDVDVGFSVLRRDWRKGYGYEAALAVMEYGRTTCGLTRIVAITAPDNEKSGRLLEKLGLRFERMIRVPGFGTESRLFS